MAGQSGNGGELTYHQALEQMGNVDVARDRAHLGISEALAETVAARHGGSATLNEVVLAIHGFELQQPTNKDQEQLRDRYNTLMARFRGQDGQPVAFIAPRYDRQDKLDGTRSPLWIGRLAAVETTITRTERRLSGRYVGAITMKLTDVHVPNWTADVSAPQADMVPTMSDEGTEMSIEPEMSTRVAHALRTEHAPGTLKIADEEAGAFAVGWDSIMRHSGDIATGDEAAERLIRRIADVMASYNQSRSNG